MEYLNKNQLLETSQESDYILIIISLIFCLISSFILMYIYKHKSNSLSSKVQIAPIIPLISNITFLVILIVKSSLALSLGLVGALSVIRFRTPIKEPEDLAFLFLAIGIGIGYGAIQIYATTIVFSVIIFVFWFFLSQTKSKIENDFNLILEVKNSDKDTVLNKIIELFKSNTIEASLFKIEKNDETNLIYFRVSFENIEKMQLIINDLNKKISNLKYTLYEHKVIE